MIFHRDTYIEREAGESANDRNDRAIRTATRWYRDHLKGTGIGVLLLTNDRENREKAKKEGLEALTGGWMRRNIEIWTS